MRRRVLGPLAAGMVVMVGCTSAPSTHPADEPTSTTSAGSGPQAGAPVWLCSPGTAADPCVSDLSAESVSASGTRSLQTATAAADSPFDCFYVYPTVSSETGPNSDLTVQPAEVLAARDQASRFSAVCRVWAPMYKQVTQGALFTVGVSALNVAYSSLVSAWQYYVQHVNNGRPIVFIGHSQGAAMLIRLLAEQVDQNPAVRKRMVVAILAGGNLQVPTGSTVGATFKNIPLCTSLKAPGCAIAYSTFGSQPPPGALFARPGTGVSLMSLQLASSGQQVACVNPASIAGGRATLVPYFLRPGTGTWVTYPGLYEAACESSGGATWLQVDTVKSPGDTRPVVTASLGPDWGYHGEDIGLALGNLVADVSALEAAYSS
jgi:hypothetical protein